MIIRTPGGGTIGVAGDDPASVLERNGLTREQAEARGWRFEPSAAQADAPPGEGRRTGSYADDPPDGEGRRTGKGGDKTAKIPATDPLPDGRRDA